MLVYKAIKRSDSMKIWTKVHIKDKDRQIEQISKSLTNYLYGYGPIQDISRKYGVDEEDRRILDQYTADRIAGLVMLFFAKNTTRLNDIINKYNITPVIEEINPEIEGYIKK